MTKDTKIKLKPLKKRLDALWAKKVKEKEICEICGRKKFLNAHHIVGRRSLNLRWDLRNGCCLCPLCHQFGQNSVHQNPMKFFLWMRKHRQDDYAYLREKIKEPPSPVKIKDLLAIELILKNMNEE
jgi:hypothetical protein